MFIDETWTATNMARSHGRSPKGERLRMGVPHGHRKTTTLIAGLRKVAEPTVAGLWHLIGQLVDIFQPTECANYFRSCGYDPE